MAVDFRLVFRGYRKSLDFKDMWPLLESDKSGYIMPRVLKHWEQEVQNTGYRSEYTLLSNANCYMTKK